MDGLGEAPESASTDASGEPILPRTHSYGDGHFAANEPRAHPFGEVDAATPIGSTTYPAGAMLTVDANRNWIQVSGW